MVQFSQSYFIHQQWHKKEWAEELNTNQGGGSVRISHVLPPWTPRGFQTYLSSWSPQSSSKAPDPTVPHLNSAAGHYPATASSSPYAPGLRISLLPNPCLGSPPGPSSMYTLPSPPTSHSSHSAPTHDCSYPVSLPLAPTPFPVPPQTTRRPFSVSPRLPGLHLDLLHPPGQAADPSAQILLLQPPRVCQNLRHERSHRHDWNQHGQCHSPAASAAAPVPPAGLERGLPGN